jgi:hypothetical protein
MTCSIGVSAHPPGIDSPELRDILGIADSALYAEKNGGRNCARLDHGSHIYEQPVLRPNRLLLNRKTGESVHGLHERPGGSREDHWG